uniref:Glycoprotein hormone subunit beta domain-containing protein n=1 Tax=Oncorhynchus kisutch TaxID=8019 RepID=A0A8C7MC65_ONCKI
SPVPVRSPDLPVHVRSPDLPVPVRSPDLPPCQPINHTVSLEKEGCPNVPISSECATQSRFSTVYLHVCTYRDVPYETIRLPDCPPWVDPCVTYPVALSCDCTCSQTSDCTIESLQPDF